MFKAKMIPLGLLMVGFVLPVAVLLILSLASSWSFPAILPRSFTTEHYQEFLFKNGGLQRSVLNSFCIATSVALLATSAGFISSRWIAFHRRKNLLLFFAYFPFALSPVIFAICLKYYFLTAGLAGNLAGVIIAQFIIIFPYSCIFFISFWNNKIRQYSNIAATLGSSVSIAYSKIILPLAKPFLVTCFFQSFIISWFEFGLTSVIGYGKIETLTIKVYQFIGEANTYYAALSACLLVLPPVILMWFNKKYVSIQNR